MRKGYKKLNTNVYSFYRIANVKTRITINISGEIYETRLETLLRFPNTLLGRYHNTGEGEGQNSKVKTINVTWTVYI